MNRDVKVKRRPVYAAGKRDMLMTGIKSPVRCDRNGRGRKKERDKNMTRIGKRSAGIAAAALAAVCLCTACGSGKEERLEGSLNDIMSGIYENADLSDDFRQGLENFETYELTDDMETAVLGTDDIEYTEGIVSMPMMSSIAYQCVLLRVDEDRVDTVKQQLKDSADLDKWVCVSAETMLIESRGDVIFYVMAENDTAYALNTAFQNY